MAYLKDLGILNQDPETLSYMMVPSPWHGRAFIRSPATYAAWRCRSWCACRKRRARRSACMCWKAMNACVCERLESPEPCALWRGWAGVFLCMPVPPARSSWLIFPKLAGKRS
jgi:hypothetical protein